MKKWFLNLVRRGSCADELKVQLASMHRSFLHSERRIMSGLDAINTEVTNLATEVAAGNAKTDLLIAGLGSVKDQLAALQKQFNSAVPITATDIAATVSSIDAVLASVKSEESKVDAALAPPAPAPAPAAAPAPADPAPVTGAGDTTTQPTT